MCSGSRQILFQKRPRVFQSNISPSFSIPCTTRYVQWSRNYVQLFILNRFTFPELYKLRDLLNIDQIEFCYRYKPDPMLALTLLCTRFACPSPLYRHCNLFGLGVSTLSTIFNNTAIFFFKRYRIMLQSHSTIDLRRIKCYTRIFKHHGGQKHI